MNAFNLKKSVAAVVLAGLSMVGASASAQVVGGGATLPQNLYGDLFTTFEPYVGVGSGGGKRAFFNNNPLELSLPAGTTVDFAGSDSLVTVGEANAYALNSEATFGKLIQIPAVLTSVTVPYNVPGVSNLNLTSEQLAAIFAGDIVNWNDPALGLVGAPNLPITVVYRQDSSGTTEIFARHLNARSGGDISVSNVFWTALGLANEAALSTIPGATFVRSNSLGTTGSGGVPQVVNATAGAIGYVSPDFVDEANNAVVARINGLLPTDVNVQAAVAAVSVPSTDEERSNPLLWGISNANPSQGYSIVASTNLILSQCYEDFFDADDLRVALDNLYGTAGTWDATIQSHGFIPLPANWKTQIHQTFVNQADALELAVGHPTVCGAVQGRPIGSF